MSRNDRCSISRNRDRVEIAARLLFLTLSPCALAAQPAGAVAGPPETASSALRAPSLPFRPGQWGGEVTVFTGFGGVGLLRFQRPARAWLFEGSLGGSLGSTSWAGSSTRTSGGASARLRSGPRHYRALGTTTIGSENTARALAFLGYGGVVSGAWTGSNVPESSRMRQVGAGVFLEGGGNAMVTTYLALGIAVSAEVQGEYRSLTMEREGERETVSIVRRMTANAGATRFVAAVFF